MNHLTATYLASGFCCCRKVKLLLTSRERSLFFLLLLSLLRRSKVQGIFLLSFLKATSLSL